MYWSFFKEKGLNIFSCVLELFWTDAVEPFCILTLVSSVTENRWADAIGIIFIDKVIILEIPCEIVRVIASSLVCHREQEVQLVAVYPPLGR